MLSVLLANTVGPIARNLGLRVTSGGVTMPTTLLGFTDAASIAAVATNNIPQVPLVALSVG